MKRSNKDQIVPIRARSLFSLEDREGRERPTKPNVRTRGSLRERRPSGRDKAPVVSTVTMNALLDLLRAEVKKLPLTVLLHGWGSPSTRSFFDNLEILKKGDALWLVGRSSESPLETPSTRLAVVLKPDWSAPNDADARLYDNLVADIVYFPGEDESEFDYLTRTARRVRTLIIEEKGNQSKELLEQVPETVRKFLWNGISLQGEFGAGSGLEGISLPPTLNAPSESELQKIGWMLKAMAQYFEPSHTKQFQFRSYLEKIKSNFSEQLEWNEQFVQMADKYEWPGWAVDSLPGLYVPLSGLSAEKINAYVWFRISDYLPPGSFEEKKRLCDGHFVAVTLTREGANRAQALAERIHEHLRKNPYFDDTAFVASVDHALREERNDGAAGTDEEDIEATKRD